MKNLELGLAGLLGLAILLAAVARIFSTELRTDMSDSLNLPGWFLIAVSVLEIVLAIDLFIPRFRILGGIGIGATMIGASIFNLLGEKAGNADPRQAVPLTLVLSIIGFSVAWLAAGRPRSVNSLIAITKHQVKGQFDLA
jgi:hypothetical protein